MNWWPLDTTNQPKSSWLQMTTSGNIYIDQTLSNMPSTDETYTLRVTYAISESEYGQEAWIYDEFTVRIKQDCSDNTITKGTAIDDSEYYIGYTEDGNTASYQIDYTVATASNTCPISAKLYIADLDSQEWVEYNSASAAQPHIVVKSSTFKSTNTGSNLDAGYFEIEVDRGTDDANKPTYRPETTYKFKVVITDDGATDPDAIEIEDEFEVVIYDKCSRNELSIDAYQDDVENLMRIDGSSLTRASTIAALDFTSTETESECPLTKTIEIYDTDTNVWTVYNPAPSGGNSASYPWISSSTCDTDISGDATSNCSGFVVTTDDDDYQTYDDETMDPTVYYIRQTVTDDYSEKTANTITTDF